MKNHTHEWSPIIEGSEADGKYCYLWQECEWVEVLDSYTSDRHDETFYEKGQSCENIRRFTFSVNLDDFPVSYDQDPARHEKIYEKLLEKLEATINLNELENGDKFSVTVYNTDIQIKLEKIEITSP